MFPNQAVEKVPSILLGLSFYVRLAVTFLIWESEWEILAVALKDLHRNNTAQLIPIDERYLLEVLP